jgi:hypothetical protein
LLTPNGMIRSFTYVDILIRNIIIKKIWTLHTIHTQTNKLLHF